MPDNEVTKVDESAEKAYAAASEAAAPAEPAKMPVKAPKAKTPPKAAAPSPAVDQEVIELPPVKKVVAATPKVKAPVKRKRKPVAKAKPAAKPKAALAAKVTPAKAKTPPVAKPKITIPPASSKKFINKESVMKMSEKFTGGLQSMMTEAQTKAKEAFEKSTVLFGDYAEFTKGNVEAMVESGKILAEGIQDMGTNLVAEGRSAFEAASADIKDMAAAKSPTDLIQIQSEMIRKNFDTAVAYGSKNTEAMLKIASEAMAPLSSRVSLAVEKVRKSAI